MFVPLRSTPPVAGTGSDTTFCGTLGRVNSSNAAIDEMKTHFLSTRFWQAVPMRYLSPIALALMTALVGCAVPAPSTTPPASTGATDGAVVPREERWSRPTAVKPPASEQDKLDEQVVLQRIMARQAALNAGRWEEAWSFLSPGTRIVVTPEQVRFDHERAVFVFDKPGSIECRGGQCDAAIQLVGKIALPRLGVRQTPIVIFERWEFVDGAAYLVPKNSAPR